MSFDITNPSPASLIESLRSIGYELSAALADIIDNSVAAQANNIWLKFHWNGANSTISVLDDGYGMSEPELVEAMRPGTFSPQDMRSPSDLGRFGLGLKTASFSQCRDLTVWSKKLGATPVNGRQWDLAYVVLHNEWRLKKNLPFPDISEFTNLRDLESGTLVVWSILDKVIGNGVHANDKEGHQKFIQHVKDVSAHLSMVFHRYISGNAKDRTAPLNIFINGSGDESKIKPWDPFGGGGAQPQRFPTESIYFHGQEIVVRGYVMPHKDRLTPEEFERMAGPRGWLAQQGYYIYRNDRILVAGDWLRLGHGRVWPKEERYTLARLSVDIPNSMDIEWDLDVKKSRAMPPAVICSRLADLADAVRQQARKVLAHRGQYGPRARNNPTIIERPWTPKTRGAHLTYQINRKHPLVMGILQRLGPLAKEIERLFRLIEESVPVERIWLDKEDGDKDFSIPYEGVDEKVLISDIKETYRYLRKRNQDAEFCKALLQATAPFDRYPELIERVIDDES